jgi:hypothetical protein
VSGTWPPGGATSCQATTTNPIKLRTGRAAPRGTPVSRRTTPPTNTSESTIQKRDVIERTPCRGYADAWPAVLLHYCVPAQSRGTHRGAGRAGFQHEATLAAEGPAWLLQDLDEQWRDPARRASILAVVRALEAEPSLLGASNHLIGVGRKPAGGTTP